MAFAGAAVAATFSRLTVVVSENRLTGAFGWGWPKHTENFDDIVAVRVVRTKQIHGWGIRWLRQGLMYNVWGLDAVALDLLSGKKFRVGMEDPQGPAASLTLVLPSR